MADDARPPVGSVAEEAARLMDALGGWAASAGYAAGTRHTEDDAEVPRTEGDATRADGGEKAGACPTCGAENGVGQAISCQVCPVCQGIALLRSVRPETVDRLADLAGALAATLRDIAAQGREASPPPGAESARSSGSRARRPRVEDIEVREEHGQ
ncbi:hypothetical protein [Knoellia koreensis]|uniref:hypothetical protein n=1 Tax=Knoellia koreensis TaxID=2730921 RepID=UPI001F0F4ABD|nr:hypothetical protein [Knoellia sp. DB2414S]